MADGEPQARWSLLKIREYEKNVEKLTGFGETDDNSLNVIKTVFKLWFLMKELLNRSG